MEPRVRITFRRRVVYDSSDSSGWAEFARRIACAWQASDEPEPPNPPDGHDLFYDAREPMLRAEDPSCDAACAAVAEALTHSRPGAVTVVHGSQTWDFTGEPELLRRWESALDRAEVAWADRHPLPVKQGDFISVQGCVLRIAAVDVKRRTVTTERLDANGYAISSIPFVRAETLRPLEGSVDPGAGDWPEIPSALQDGLARARWRINVHQDLLERAGLVDPDD